MSLTHPTESLFVPASIVSFGTILINISQYGPEATGPWLSYTVGVLFWIDAALAVIFSAGIYLLL
jgi:tellurite resistance protein TehA-like permease